MGELSTDLPPERLAASGLLEEQTLGSPPGRGGGRLAWLARRIGSGILVLFIVSILIFLATQALPGNAARAILGGHATPQSVATLEAQLHLNEPLVSQYLTWLGNVLTGDLGVSLGSHEPVTQLIGDRLVNSMILVGLSAGIAVPLSIFLGAYAGYRRNKAFDHGSLSVMLVLTALPEFVVGFLLVILFSTTVFELLPSVTLLSVGESPFNHPDQLILPVVTLVLAVLPYLTRLVRGSVIDVSESEYVRMARLKGVPERVVLRRHVLRNALVPAIQGTSITLAYLLGGIVIIENLFNYPGLGSLLISSVGSRDLPAIQAIVLIFAAAYVIFNIIADVLTVYATPRLRTADSWTAARDR